MLQKRTRLVLDIIEQLVADGATVVRPGDVATELRDRGQPLGTWEIRYEFSILEKEGLVEHDAETGRWQLKDDAARKTG